MSVPGWTRHKTVIWVVEDTSPRCDDVGDAHVATTAYVAQVAQAAELPARMRLLRARGASVKTADGVCGATKAAARKLRAALSAVSPCRLADVADDLELGALAAALRQWPQRTPSSFFQLAEACMDRNEATPRLSRAARLLLALEHL